MTISSRKSARSFRKPGRRQVAIALTVLLSATMVFLAGRQIVLNVRFASILKLSGELDRTDRISPQVLDRAMPDTVAIVASGICRADIIEAGKKLLMRDLDRRSSGPNPEARNPEAWQQTLARAETYIRHGLSCLPANGDLWLRLAMLRQASAAPASEVAGLMVQSQMLNPAEAGIITARMALWTKLPPQTRALAARAYDADLAILCSPHGSRIRKLFEAACKPTVSG